MIDKATIEQVIGHPLSDDQWVATTAPLAPGVIVAGAGSGKTSVMAARVLWAVGSEQLRAEEVLGLTFTNKAAAELLGRVRRFLTHYRTKESPRDPADAPALGDPVIATYHSFSSGLITDNAIRLGLEPTARVLTAGARAQIAARIVRTADVSLAVHDRSLVTWVEAMLALDDSLADTGVEAEDLAAFDENLIAVLNDFERSATLQVIGADMRATARARRDLVGLVKRFRAEKAHLGTIDFADQTRLALILAGRFPEVMTEMRERFRLVLLDEYQDTSPAQRMLLQRMFGDGHPVTAVGDPFQSIYGFRGATVANIDNFALHFPDGHAPARVYNLLENRRSGPAILGVANHITSKLRDVHPNVKPLVAASLDKGPGLLTCALFDTVGEETEWVVEHIEGLHAEGEAWRDIAVLVRTRESAHQIDRALQSVGIPTQVEGASRLLETPEIVELTCMLEALADPTANVAMMRLMSGPRWALGVRDLAAIGAFSKRMLGKSGRRAGLDVHQALIADVASSDESECVSLLEAIGSADEIEGLSDEGRRRISLIAAELNSLRQHLDEPLVDIIARVLAVSGLGVELTVGDDAVCNARVAALDEFMSIAAQFVDPDGTTSLVAFLALLRASEMLDASLGDAPASDTPDAVRIMTMHKAKGLEFKHVIVPFMAQGVFPSSKGATRWPKGPAVIPWALRDDAPAGLKAFPDVVTGPTDGDHKKFQARSKEVEQQEDLRLAYVALTRAEVTLAVSAHWWGPSQKTKRGPNEMLKDFHAFVGVEGGVVRTWASEPAKGAENPALGFGTRSAFPVPRDPAALAGRLAARDAVLAHLAGQPGDALGCGDDTDLARIAEWDRDLPVLVKRAHASASTTRTVRLPDGLSASDVIRLARDPQRFAVELARPMPQRPAPAADRGTRFHAWVESRFGQQPLLLPEDLPGAADEEISESDLDLFKANFERSVYANRRPMAIEQPFALVLAGRVVCGRIDAVFAVGDRIEVVDWKTGRKDGTDALQLSIYRLAWSELTDTPIDRIDASFYYVATDEVSREALMSRAEVEAILRGESLGPVSA